MNNLGQLRHAHAKSAIFFLPAEQTLLGEGFVDPLRRTTFNQLKGLGDRHRRGQGKQNVDVIGDAADYVHVLLSLPSTMSISKALQLIKGGSSKWVHETFPEQRLFGWQEKYGAFSVSVSQLTKIVH